MVNSAQITSATGGAGNAGRIEINAESVRLEAAPNKITQIAANTWFGGGRGGDIVIRTATLDMLNGATILGFSAGPGLAGLIDINAQSVNLLRRRHHYGGSFRRGERGERSNHGRFDSHRRTGHLDRRTGSSDRHPSRHDQPEFARPWRQHSDHRRFP